MSIVELSQSPRVQFIANFLTPEECDYLKKRAQPLLDSSTTLDNETGKSILHPARTSSGCAFRLKETEVIKAIEERIESLTNLPISHGEGMQVMCYGKGQEYKPHFDYFDPQLKGSKPTLDYAGQRLVTIIMYLNEGFRGGETIFPRLGLSVTPQQGAALLFWNVSNGLVDEMTLHGGAPVVEGEKWIMTKWVRERIYA